MIIPVVVGVIVLGKAFDLYHVTPTKHQIINKKDIEDNLQVIPLTCNQRNYKIVKTASDVNELLKLDPYISLKVKNSNARALELEGYLATVINRNKTLEILMMAEIETETEIFPPRLRTEPGWQDKPQSEVGTHYVSSIKYGGLLVASLRLNPSKPEYFAQIEKAIASKIPSYGSINELFFENLESVVSSVHEKASISLSLVSTAGITGPITNIKDLAKLVHEYSEIVGEVKGGKGLPLRVELEDLYRVQSNYTPFAIKPELKVFVEEANEKLEDLRVALKLFRDWERTGPVMTKEEEELVKGFSAKLHNSVVTFKRAITNLHYNGESNQFDEAFNVYNSLNENSPYRYTYTLERFIKIISDKSFFKRFYILSVRWMKSVLGK